MVEAVQQMTHRVPMQSSFAIQKSCIWEMQGCPTSLERGDTWPGHMGCRAAGGLSVVWTLDPGVSLFCFLLFPLLRRQIWLYCNLGNACVTDVQAFLTASALSTLKVPSCSLSQGWRHLPTSLDLPLSRTAHPCHPAFRTFEAT